MNRKILFNDKWTFAKTSLGVTYEERESWEREQKPVDLPHDWLIYDTENLYEDSIGWYVREFEYEKRTDPHLDSDRILLRFEGVYMDSTLYVNGRIVGEWKYGYSTFEWDITEFLISGKNEILMKVVYQSPNSRWYSGAGIYRDVWLIQVPAVHIVSDGIYVSTREIGRDFELLADTELTWGDGTVPDCGFTVSYTLCDGDEIITAITNELETGQIKDTSALLVKNPGRWDLDNPKLYQLEVSLCFEGKVLHREVIPVGFRKIDFSPEEGFFLNNRQVKLHGTCDHHDFGALGAAFSRAAMRRKFELMRKMGVNAIRTSHNMPAPGLMDLADEMGFLVVCESFDCWEIAKTKYDYARFFDEWLEKDITSWIRRDRNHPSLIMWSIGNEIPDTHASTHGQDIVRRFINDIGKWDYRFNAKITIGSNYMPWENAQKCADILKYAGYNYAEKLYEEHHREHPDWIIYGSETGSVLQSRGVYHFPLERATLIEEDEQCSALGNSTASWAAKNAEYNIIMDRDAEFCCGQFIWTAIDYIGEPTPYQTKNSYFGQMDTAGFPKDSFYLYQAEWTDYKKNPMVHVYPYWDFNEGQLVDIRVSSNAPEVELWVNEKSFGRVKIDHKRGQILQPSFRVPYEPGEIRAIAYDEKGNVIAEERRHSFKDTAKLVLTPERTELKADGEDLMYIAISAEDKDGYPVENASDYVRVTVEGAARLVGLDNGDSTDYDQYKGTVRKLFGGKLMAILKSGTTPGKVRIRVEDAKPKNLSDGAGEKKSCHGTADNPNGKDGMGDVEKALLQPAELTFETTKAPLRGNIETNEQNRDVPLAKVETGFVPVRKIELKAERLVIDKECPKIEVTAVIYPADATDRELIWKVVDEGGLESRIAEIEIMPESAACNACAGTKEENIRGIQNVRVKGLGDGAFLIRCMTKNGTDKIKLISQLDLKIEGMGAAFVSPYEPVVGATYTESAGDVARGPELSAGFDKQMETRLSFTNLDFGDYGSDEITMAIFANDADPHEIQIYTGIPDKEGSRLVGDVVYQKPGKWEVFQPDTFKLNERVSGIQTISIVGHDKWYLRDFVFTKQNKAFAKLDVARYGTVYGDSFEKKEQGIEHIGNNVSLAFDHMDFGVKGAGKITICGRTPLQTNTIQIRFVGNDGVENVQVIPFPHNAEYTELTFEIEPVKGENQVNFVFLPGCDFDFAWFRFHPYN